MLVIIMVPRVAARMFLQGHSNIKSIQMGFDSPLDIMGVQWAPGPSAKFCNRLIHPSIMTKP